MTFSNGLYNTDERFKHLSMQAYICVPYEFVALPQCHINISEEIWNYRFSYNETEWINFHMFCI